MTIGSTSASAFNGSNQCPVAEETTTYSPIISSSYDSANSQNTVTDPAGNYVIYQFSDDNPFGIINIPQVETQREYFAN